MKRPRVNTLLTTLSLALLLSACTQWRYELGARLSPNLLPEESSNLTLTDVLAKLGPPLRLSAAGEGYILAWEFWKIREDTIGLSLGALGSDILSVDWGKAHMHGEFLLVTFNRQHQVTGRAFSRWSSDGGGGQAIQPLVGLVSLVDVEDMVDKLPHHQWGSGLLLPLPEAMNAQSRPDMGQTGIQRRGTPNGVGQRSLE
tara:strand:- start:298838 stop:299437 length:600 start_codon:yes stop_codon:yes gene_type:complete